MKFNYILWEKSDNILTLTMNRPAIHNAFNDVMITEVINACDEILLDTSIRLVVLTGAGKSFCAGADLNWMQKMKDYSERENIEDSLKLANMFRALNNLPVPLIGKVNGHSLGGGMGLMAVCDYVVCVDEAKLGFSEVKLGLVPAVISPYVMAKIGESYARAYFLSGQTFNPAVAMKMQLVHKVATKDTLDLEVSELCAHFLKAGPVASKTAKELIFTIRNCPVEEVREHTTKVIAQMRINPEGQEGMAALLQKRKTSWQK